LIRLSLSLSETRFFLLFPRLSSPPPLTTQSPAPGVETFSFCDFSLLPHISLAASVSGPWAPLFNYCGCWTVVSSFFNKSEFRRALRRLCRSAAGVSGPWGGRWVVLSTVLRRPLSPSGGHDLPTWIPSLCPPALRSG